MTKPYRGSDNEFWVDVHDTVENVAVAMFRDIDADDANQYANDLEDHYSFPEKETLGDA